jgi:quercetin dioxygenase-like cupin family protein
MRRVEFPHAGDWLNAHAHYYDHVTFVVQGAVAVRGRVIDAPGFLEVPADTEHEVTALRDHTVTYCVFAVRDEFGHVLQTDEIEPSDRHQGARFAD